MEELESLQPFKADDAASDPTPPQSEASEEPGSGDPVDGPVPDDPGPVRDVPAGIPTLVNDDVQDSWRSRWTERSADDKKKLRRLFDAAAAAAVVVVFAAIVLQVLGVWTQDPTPDGVNAGKIASDAASRASTESSAEAGPSADGTQAASELAEASAERPEERNSVEIGIVDGLLDTLGFGRNGSHTETADQSDPTTEDSNASVTIILGSPQHGEKPSETVSLQVESGARTEQPGQSSTEPAQP